MHFQLPYFFSGATATYYFITARLLFEGGYYSNGVFISLGSWQIAASIEIGTCMRAIQIGMIDDVISTRSLSVLLSGVKTSLKLEHKQAKIAQ